MEGGVRSGRVLKQKNSSGCLIVKKKNGGGFSDDSKGRKRERLAATFSDSSDEEESLALMRRRVTDKRLNNGTVGRKRDKDSYGNEPKRSRLDLFEFDEYDEFDGDKMRNEYTENRFKMKEFGVSSSVVGKRKQDSCLHDSRSGKSKDLECNDVRNKSLESEEDEANMPISLLRLKHQQNGNQSIRLQGKNGVLKVMVNKKKKMDFPSHPKSCNGGDAKGRKSCRSDDDVKNGVLAQPSAEKEKSVDDKTERKLVKVKPDLNKGNNASSGSSKKGMKKEEERSPDPENVTPVKGKGKTKRGGSTEKQMLREKIRGMLIEAGWTIDYRPRRDRDYLDAVYINPNGTAIWSIIKAYGALKKQLEEDNGTSGAYVASATFATLSEDINNKLTRQTKKKTREGLNRKRKDGTGKSNKKSAVREDTDSSDSDQMIQKPNYKSRGGKIHKLDRDNDYDSNDDSPKRKPGKARIERPYNVSKSSVIQGRKSRVYGRCTLLVRGSNKGENSDSDGYVPYRGKRTVLAWLIDTAAAKLSEKVQYMNRRRSRVMLEGWLTRDGIHCGCCSKILSVMKFEMHAGSKLRQPFQNIFLESGSSLLQCQIDAWNSQEESARRDFHFVDVDGDDPDDDTCGICGDGGDLVCCDSCPSTFHQLCLEIEKLPSGDWHCPNCTCKFCGSADGGVAEENDTVGNELNKCSFCEKKYHKSGCESVSAPSVSSNDASFCELKCQELYDHLQKILGVKHELGAGFSWSLSQRTDVSDASHCGYAQRVECNSKLAVALSVMDECFLPIIDRRSGINIIHNVVYNCRSNFNRLSYCGFYTVILEQGDEIISAAAVRLHGSRLAEMPFIGTREIYRRQGMCRRLLSVIENELSCLKVEKLVIPAISEHMNTWTAVFGFHELGDAADKKEIKSLNMLVFPGTDMLQKQLVSRENSDGMPVSEPMNNHPVLVKESEVDSPLQQTAQTSSDSDSKVDATDKLANPSNDHTSASVAVHESNNLPAVENKQSESDIDCQLRDHPAVEELVSNQSKAETPCLELVHDTSAESLNANEANGIPSPTNDGNTESPPSSVSKTSSQSTADKANGVSVPESCLKTVVNDEPWQRSNQDPSPDPTATIGSSIIPDVHGNKENGSSVQISPHDLVPTVNDNRNCTPVSSSGIQESIPTPKSASEAADPAETHNNVVSVPSPEMSAEIILTRVNLPETQ